MQSMCASCEDKQCILPHLLVSNELGERWHMKIVGLWVFFQMPLTLYHFIIQKKNIMTNLSDTSALASIKFTQSNLGVILNLQNSMACDWTLKKCLSSKTWFKIMYYKLQMLLIVTFFNSKPLAHNWNESKKIYIYTLKCYSEIYLYWL